MTCCACDGHPDCLHTCGLTPSPPAAPEAPATEPPSPEEMADAVTAQSVCCEACYLDTRDPHGACRCPCHRTRAAAERDALAREVTAARMVAVVKAPPPEQMASVVIARFGGRVPTPWEAATMGVVAERARAAAREQEARDAGRAEVQAVWARAEQGRIAAAEKREQELAADVAYWKDKAEESWKASAGLARDLEATRAERNAARAAEVEAARWQVEAEGLAKAINEALPLLTEHEMARPAFRVQTSVGRALAFLTTAALAYGRSPR